MLKVLCHHCNLPDDHWLSSKEFVTLRISLAPLGEEEQAYSFAYEWGRECFLAKCWKYSSESFWFVVVVVSILPVPVGFGLNRVLQENISRYDYGYYYRSNFLYRRGLFVLFIILVVSKRLFLFFPFLKYNLEKNTTNWDIQKHLYFHTMQTPQPPTELFIGIL